MHEVNMFIITTLVSELYGTLVLLHFLIVAIISLK